MPKKNYLDPAVQQELRTRIDSLTTESFPRWGKMNVKQGLRHMGMAFKMAIGEVSEPFAAPALLRPIWKFGLLNMTPLKGKIQTFPSFDMVARKIDPEELEAEKADLKAAMDRYLATGSYVEYHPLGGRFNNENWGRVMYVHTDHHLRQFGA